MSNLHSSQQNPNQDQFTHADEFGDRKAELRTIFDRLMNGESTAVVSKSHLGKSALLLKLLQAATQQVYLGQTTSRFIFSQVNLRQVSNDFTPQTFWQQAMEPLHRFLVEAPGITRLDQAAQSNYDRRSLERLFNYLAEERQQILVLVLDDFDRLLSHPNFQVAAFFALLRSLATRTGGLALVTASRLSVAEMDERGQNLLDLGSPFFDNMIEVNLHST